MAFENFPEAEKTSQTVVTPPARKNNLRGILTGVLVVALLGTWGYIIWDKNNTKETIAQKETVIATTSTQRDELQKELADATMRYDMLKTSNSKKDSAITAQDRDIAAKRQEIQRDMASPAPMTLNATITVARRRILAVWAVDRV